MERSSDRIWRERIKNVIKILQECDGMDKSKKIIELRESTGMNRRQFCDYFQIPYRTVTEWERDNRHAPDYVIRLLEYYIQSEKLVKEKDEQ